MPFDQYLLMVRREPEEGFEKEFHRCTTWCTTSQTTTANLFNAAMPE